MKTIKAPALALLALGAITAVCAAPPSEPTASPGDASSFSTIKLKNNQGLVAHWKFDEAGESDVCADSSGNGFNGAAKTPIRRGEGKAGRCLSLAGDQVVNLPATMPFPTAPMSFSVWVKPREVLGRQYIITYLPGTTAQRGEYEYAFHLDNGGEPRFWIWGHVVKGDKQEKWGLVSKAKLPVDEWTHLAVTIGPPTGDTARPSRKEGAVNLTFTMYQNGVATVTAIFPVPPFLPNMAHAIGSKPAGECSLKGDLDELMVFNRTLSAQEVEALYKKQLSPVAAPRSQ